MRWIDGIFFFLCVNSRHIRSNEINMTYAVDWLRRGVWEMNMNIPLKENESAQCTIFISLAAKRYARK